MGFDRQFLDLATDCPQYGSSIVRAALNSRRTNIFQSVAAVIVVLLSVIPSVQAQKQANIWHFGSNAGLDFNFTPPKAITNSSLSALEGCASICDAKGDILFYTDGLTVWNKRDSVMTNGTGLNGHNSSTQSAVIVPHPSNVNQYYIFTVDGSTGSRKGGYYNIVDMTKSAGLGEVTLKNQVIFNHNYPFESIGATPSANGRSYWVCYVDTNATILAYNVTSKGINLTPVRSRLKNYSATSTMSHYMKFSSDNTMMAVAIAGYGLTLSKFDPTSGRFSNSFLIDKGSSWNYYGVEFSPESKFLYCSNGNQYDVSTFDSALIVNSAYNFETGTIRASLQLGPDGKIYYRSHTSSTKMSFINYPDKKDSACTVYADSIDLNGRRALLGLPTFLQSLLNPSLISKGICFGEPTPFHITDSLKLDSAVWNFGDTASGKMNTATSFSPRHIFTSPGQYEVTTLIYHGAGVDTLSAVVSIKDYLGTYRMIGEDIFKCRDDSVDIKLANDTNYLKQVWSTSDTIAGIRTSIAGVYWIKAYEGKGCFFTDTMTVYNYPNNEVPDVLGLIDTIEKCPEKVVKIGTKQSFFKYSWNTGETTGEVNTDKKGRFILTVYHDSTCISRDTTDIIYFPTPKPNLGRDSSFCSSNKQRVGDLNTPFASYLWNTGSTDPFIFTDTSGTYIMNVETNQGCLMSDTVMYSFVAKAPDLLLPKDTAFCDSVGLNAYIKPVNQGGEAPFVWQSGTSDSAIFINGKGMYVVSAKNACGQDVDSFLVRVIRSPEVSLQAKDSFCDSVRVVLQPDTTGDELQFLWSTTDTLLDLEVDTLGTYWIEARNKCGVDTAYTEIIQWNTPTAEPILDSILCIPFQHEQKLVSGTTGNSYTWRDPVRQSILSLADSVSIFDAGQYIAEISNYCGNYADTFTLTGYTIPVVDLGADSYVCDSLSETMNIGQAQNGEQYRWSTGDTTSGIQVKDPGSYWAVATNKCGSDADTIELSLYYTTVVSLPSDTVVCDETALDLDVTIPGVNNEYFWAHGPTTPEVSITQDGSYSVTVKNLCTDQQRSIDVQFLKTPVRSLQPEYIFCDAIEPTDLIVGMDANAENYSWSTGERSKTLTANSPGTYVVLISNACAEITDSSTIILSTSPIVDLGPDTPVCGEIEYLLDAGNPGLTYNWSTGEVTQQIIATEQTVYAVTVTNNEGCMSFGQMEITDDCRTTIHLPDVFSPNGDGLNDVYKPVHFKNVTDYEFYVYNRWGEKIFTSNDPDIGWDGNYLGKEALIGAYLVRYRYRNLEKGYFEGDGKVIYLVR